MFIAVNPKVVDVQPSDDFSLLLTFANGERRVFDVSPYLGKGVFRELADVRNFCQVRAESGYVTWPHEQDFCRDTLYLRSRAVVDSVAA